MDNILVSLKQTGVFNSFEQKKVPKDLKTLLLIGFFLVQLVQELQ
jgi:hypothetical protein